MAKQVEGFTGSENEILTFESDLLLEFVRKR